MQHLIRKAVVMPAVFILMGLTGYGVVTGVIRLGLMDRTLVPTRAVPAPTPDESARAEALLEEHDCWTGKAPPDMQGQIPTYAVVTLPDSRAALVSSEVGFDIWLEGEPGFLHGFCR